MLLYEIRNLNYKENIIMINMNFIYKNRTLLYTLNNIFTCALVFKSILTNSLNTTAVCILIFVFNLYAYSRLNNMRLE
jgi:hypothetical protein